jgi:signal transduction histidine kinase
MPAAAIPEKSRGLALMFNWPRIRSVLIIASVFGFLVGSGWKSGFFSGYLRVVAIAFAAMIAFGIFEQWPRRLPRWLGRWVLQVLATAVVIPFVTVWIYNVSTEPGALPFWKDMPRMEGFATLTGMGIFFCPWIALAALVRQKDALARHQALEFDLARSELQRQALDARLNLLQAQVAPHFLFNTLANVKALVDSGSPRASAVLDSLIAYLRAAVPQLHQAATTVGQELQLVRAYLELMHMRMPDRLQFGIHVDPEALQLRCAPMTLLTLVENAVRHGIDPSEEGGSIQITVRKRGERCIVQVGDTGMGLQESSQGLGTGLSSLRERLELIFGGDAELRLSEQQPHGMVAEVEFPAREALA